MQVRTINMKEVSFRVRIHNLILIARNEQVGELVGLAIGVFEEVNLEQGEVE